MRQVNSAVMLRWQIGKKDMMKSASKIVLLFTFIIAQTACTSGIESKRDFIDISVNGIRLLDSDSYIEKFGLNINFFESENVVYTQHYNQAGNEMLTVISKHSAKFSATKLRVAKLDKKFLLKRHVMEDVVKFITGKGVRLGMSSLEVSEILGNPNYKEMNDDGITIYRYELLNSGAEMMIEEKKYSLYSSEFSFYDDKLIEFIFGI